MTRTNSNRTTSITLLSMLCSLLISSFAAAQVDDAATLERQAAQLRVEVDARIAELDAEYTIRATDLRRQFNDRRRELEASTDSEIELSSAMAAIGRVYQDSSAALQREISARKDSVYAAQNQANDELTRQGTISAGTWSRVSPTPLEELIAEPAPAVSAAEPAVAAAEVPPVIVEEPAPVEAVSVAETAATISTAEPPQPEGCEIRWYPDSDRDLFGDAGSAATLACYPSKPAGFVDNDYDCDDSDPTINPITGRCGNGQP